MINRRHFLHLSTLAGSAAMLPPALLHAPVAQAAGLAAQALNANTALIRLPTANCWWWMVA